ncbi:response regulator [Bacillus salipaludis]|uniref:Response regulator n=1 Tax=Bacillus salipaludis TaxID=2547811 RepID=A0A4V3AT61_9BACI|nr:response regulator [Bacillus salipaludis]MDQ6596288.1 response regulator [Bacillus salipaludis]TDK58396.1 response regulator [Bacillus salipaludis]
MRCTNHKMKNREFVSIIDDDEIIRALLLKILKTIEIVKKMTNGSNISVFMLSGRKSESYVQRALLLGADDYVTKPFGIQELKERIRRLLIGMI